MPGPGIEPPTSGMPSGCDNHYTTAPLCESVSRIFLFIYIYCVHENDYNILCIVQLRPDRILIVVLFTLNVV